MADLIKEFFERELTEAEAESLGKQLQQSPEDALRFESGLEQHYLATGLPIPQLPKGLGVLPGTGGMGAGGWIALATTVILAGSVLIWKFWPQAPVEAPLKAVNDSLSTAQPVKSLAHIAAAVKPVLPAAVVPQPVESTAEGEELSVVVGAQVQSLVTVRVLDSKGQEVRDLYTGFVQPGHWSFHWDGELTNGAPAPAGNYQIDVQNGAHHQTKVIRIKPE
jgi:hypothetical protein